MSQQNDQQRDGAKRGLTGADLSGASVESSGSSDGVGRQSGQQREHGHTSREDQEQDRSGSGSGTDQVSGHPDASSESVQRGRSGGTGK